MRRFHRASLHSSFPAPSGTLRNCTCSVPFIASRRLFGAHDRAALCCLQHRTGYSYTGGGAAAEVRSTSDKRCLCLGGVRRLHTGDFSESRAAPVYQSQKIVNAHRSDGAVSSFAASSPDLRDSRNASTTSTVSGDPPRPTRPHRTARHVTLRRGSADSPYRAFPMPPKSATSRVPSGASPDGDAESTPPLKMVFSCRDKFEAVNENDGYDGNAQPGGGKGRDHRGVQSIHGVAAQRFIRVNNSDPPPIRAGQNLQQQQRQKTKKQAPPNTISVPRTRNSINVPGGDLSNVCAVSALTVDINAEGRVLVMLKSDQRRANPDCVLRVPEAELFNVPHSTLKRCVLPLRIPGVSQDVLAIGQSTKAKIARALCFMHAENLLDFFASVDTTEEPSVEPTPPPSSTSWPPPLEEKKVTGVAAAPKERDFHSWDAYVDASERYVHDTADKARADVLARGQIPLSGHPIADRAAVLMRRHRQQFCHPQVLGELNESMSDGSRLIRTAHLASKVFVATLKLDPTTGLTATGVAKSSKDARRECAGHALCILQLLQQEAEGLPQGSPLAVPAAGGARGALPKRSNKGKKEEVGEDATLPGATLDAVLQHLRPSHGKLLRFFNLLFDNNELSPTTTFTRETTTNGTVLYHCQLTLGDITCSGKGVNRFEAQRSAMDGGVTELLLYDTRLQTLQSFIDTYPAITPELIPSAALPRALVERLRQQLQPVAQRQLAAKETKRTGARAPDEVEMEEDDSRNFNREEQALVRLSERAFATDPFYNAQMLDALLSLRQHPTYLVKFHPRRSTLAMAQVRQQVLDAVQHHRVTVVCGTTGCGKTTQVPQYLLDHEIEQGRGGSCNILVTQPRRLSSFSVAERIAHERLSVVGKDVGYAVRLDARPGRHITICTTGVLLQIFSTHPELEHVSHLIIDEVHERDINCDVVLALVKGLLTRNPRLRVVLMSATMQSEMFAKYFGEDTPVIQVEGAVYPVSVRYLEDIAVEAASVRFYSPNFDIVPLAQDPEKGEQANQHITSPRALMRKPPKTDYNLIAYLVHRAVQVDLQNQTTGKSILVFLPGWKEMVSAKAAIEHYGGPYAITSFNMRFHLILLHSTVDSAKQRECFVPAPAGMVKVVLATNIAESGITIDDAAVVIDTGLIKTTTWAGRPSPNTSLFVPLNSNPNPTSTDSPDALKGATTPSPVFSTQLTLGYASQANGTQRKGRAGRTQHGVCYRLYTKSLWDALPAFPEADIHRVPLTQILLKLLSLGYAHPRETLQTFLEPPSPTNVEVSMRLLRDIGAVDEADQLTPLGEYLAKLPCDPRIGKMIIVGAVLRCLDSVLTVAACADVSPYVTSREQAAAARKKRYLFARSSQSDHISFLNAFNAYCANGERDDFARFNLLQLGNIRIISKYKAQYRDILLHAGLISEQDVLYGAGGAHTAVLGGVGGTDVDLEEDDDDDVLLDSGDVTAAEETGATMPARNPINPGAASTTAAEPTRCYTGELCVDTSQQSCNSCDVALVKACVCAALFPNVAVLRPPPLNAGSSLRRKRQAEKVELRTKHFTSIKPSKESACRRVGGPREQAKPNCTELLSELSKDAGGGAGGGSPSSSPPSATAPAMFYVFQDVFSVRESRQEFLTTLSSVSLWALLLFGASESTVQYYSDLSLCIIDGWIAVHIDNATYRIVTELRQALYTCLRDKYHHPRDEQNNTALRSVTEMCQAVLKAPVLELSATATEDETEQSSDETSAATRASRLVDTGSIVDPLALVRHNSRGADTASANGFAILGVDDGADASDDSGLEEEEEEGVVF